VGTLAEAAREAPHAPEAPEGRAVADVWTDSRGVVHERDPEDKTRTRCGKPVNDVSYRLLASRACNACVNENLRQYALHHDCAKEGCGLPPES